MPLQPCLIIRPLSWGTSFAGVFLAQAITRKHLEGKLTTPCSVAEATVVLEEELQRNTFLRLTVNDRPPPSPLPPSPHPPLELEGNCSSEGASTNLNAALSR